MPVIVEGKLSWSKYNSRRGAGPEATTSALISDISSILRGNIKFPFWFLTIKEKTKF